MHDLKQAQSPENSQLNSMMIDPAVNLLFKRMKAELTDAKDKLEQAQNDLSAWKFTPDRLVLHICILMYYICCCIHPSVIDMFMISVACSHLKMILNCSFHYLCMVNRWHKYMGGGTIYHHISANQSIIWENVHVVCSICISVMDNTRTYQ